MKNKIYFLVLSLLSFVSIYGQYDLKKIVPPNPNVASLMKATMTPITEYAGLPNINIPLYTISEDNINVPISLSYHTGGIQVSEESGIVGLGWALNAGGVISRSINGYGDFGEDPLNSSTNTYLNFTGPIPDQVLTNNGNGPYFNLSNNQFIRADVNCNFLVNNSLTYIGLVGEYTPRDFMPDTYHFNFNGYSGSFVMKKDGSIFLLEKNGLKITWEYEPGLNNFSFSIVTEDGAKYTFKDWAKTNTDMYMSSSWHISTWYLSKITTVNGGVVDFIYEEKGKSYPLKSFFQSYYAPGAWVTGMGTQAEIDDIYLIEIQFSKGKVKFNYSDSGVRQDISTAYYLENIEILDINQKSIKKHDFNYSYFGSASASSGSVQTGDYAGDITINSSNPSLNLRLRLDEVTEDEIKTHSFDYHDAPLAQIPNKTTMSQDYWGFYNGIANYDSFIPYGSESMGGLPIKAKRYPVESKAKLFSLYRITYPTKGYTDFEFESNTYNTELNQIPTSYVDPPPTVQKSDYVSSFGGGVITSKIVDPQGESVIVRFDLAIYGSNVEDRYQHPFNFQTDMDLKIRQNSNGAVIWSENFPSSEAYMEFAQTGQVFHSVSLDIGTAQIGGYTIEAYFNDHSGLYFGQAKITVTWEETQVSETEKYSLGGGLRIKSVTDFDFNGEQLRKRNFNYHFKDIVNSIEVDKSYGLLKTYPKFSEDHAFEYTPFENQSVSIATHTLIGRAFSGNNFSKDKGSYVGYDQVTMTYEDNTGKDNGKTVSKFYNNQDHDSQNNLGLSHFDGHHKFPSIRLPHNGLLYKQEKYKRLNDDSYVLIQESDTEYSINGISVNGFDFQDLFFSSDYVISSIQESTYDITISDPCLLNIFQFHPHYSTLVQKQSQKETIYDTNGQNPIITQQNFYYENPIHYQLTKSETIDSKGNTILNKFFYPDDVINASSLIGGVLSTNQLKAIDSLKIDYQHRIAESIQSEIYKNGSLLSIQRTNYKNWGIKINSLENIILQETVQTSKGSESLDDRIIYHDYDQYGNPQEVSKSEGVHIVYIWGYNHEFPVAKVENANYNDVINTGINLITINNTTTTDISLRAELDMIRQTLTTAMVTTYTYDPLIGITSVTDPKGYTTYYQYDDFGRLKIVKDHNGNILSNTSYSYKQ